ncbi:glutaredoxin family protein [Cellvibrio sp.]|uniref:glutaredoxin family protein n=1 Tax=Cellvibrio sp. TaxID=1965322 RepID=UPI0039647837
MKVYLYSTLGCHLCEKAKEILWPLLQRYQRQLVEVDIAEDDTLIERYGIRIPVLGAVDSSRELNWPFSAEQVDEFLASLAEHQ